MADQSTLYCCTMLPSSSPTLCSLSMGTHRNTWHLDLGLRELQEMHQVWQSCTARLVYG